MEVWKKKGGVRRTELKINDMRQGVKKSRDGEWGEGDRGIIDMSGGVRRGDKRCGSSILRASSAWRGGARGVLVIHHGTRVSSSSAPFLSLITSSLRLFAAPPSKPPLNTCDKCLALRRQFIV